MQNPEIVVDEKVSKITIHRVADRLGIAAELFGRLGEEGLCVGIMTVGDIIDSHTDISIIVAADIADSTMKALESMREELGASTVTRSNDAVAISVLTKSMHQPGFAGRVFRALTAANVRIDMITAMKEGMTCVIDERFQDTALEALRLEFPEAKES